MADSYLHIVNGLLAAKHLDVAPLVLLILLFVALWVVLYFQIRNGKRLKSELNLLKTLTKHNVEYEFVLEVMQLSIWHYDVTTGQLTFEHDYREKGNKYFTNVDGMLLVMLIRWVSRSPTSSRVVRYRITKSIVSGFPMITLCIGKRVMPPWPSVMPMVNP